QDESMKMLCWVPLYQDATSMWFPVPDMNSHHAANRTTSSPAGCKLGVASTGLTGSTTIRPSCSGPESGRSGNTPASPSPPHVSPRGKQRLAEVQQVYPAGQGQDSSSMGTVCTQATAVRAKANELIPQWRAYFMVIRASCH